MHEMCEGDRDDVEGCGKVGLEAEVLEGAECIGSKVCGRNDMIGVV